MSHFDFLSKDFISENAWENLMLAFPTETSVVSEATLYDFRHRVNLDSESTINAIDWALSSLELRRIETGLVKLTNKGLDRYRRAT